MSPQVDEAVVRQFIKIVSDHAAGLINGADRTGFLQLCRINPIDDKNVVPSRFKLDDVESMVRTAIGDAGAGHNVYIETRTVRDDLRGNKRGSLEDTVWVFGLVADCDADKNKGGNITVRPSLAIETSPGNFQLWYLFTRVVPAAQAKLIGDAIRANSGTDQDTGVVTQCYRVAGTPNFPSAAKRARGRTAVEPTKIFEHTGRLWDPDELLAAFSTPSPGPQPAGPEADEATLPDDLLQTIRDGDGGDPKVDRSGLFHSVIGQLKRRHWTAEAIAALLEKYPNGIAKKYLKRLRKEVERSYNKIANGVGGGVATIAVGAAAGAGATPGAGAGTGAGTGATPAASAAPGAGARPHIIPTIRLVDGQLSRAVNQAEHALLSAGLPVFARAGTLVEPVSEAVPAAHGRKTVIARLRPLCPDSLLETVAEAAIFQRYNLKRSLWVDVDPPLQLVRMILVRERRWAIPRVAGIITTPTLRPDGSVLATPGYDPRSELYLVPGFQLPPIPERPTREQARVALNLLIDLFSEFSFKDNLDRSVALAGLLTAQIRGSLFTAPIILVHASTPGTGKSYLVDLIAVVTTGRVCPVITTAEDSDETNKRIGAILLGGVPIISLDNCTHDLGGETLCQLTERPVIGIRILGRSEMPECECHIAVFATGNNITFKRDMVRRGLVCNLEALTERPELREFQHDALERAAANRGAYVAAVLTIIRAYLAAGAPRVCGPLGSYAAWSIMVRSPLVWWGSRTRSRAWIGFVPRTPSSAPSTSCLTCGSPMISVSIRRTRLAASSRSPVSRRRQTTSTPRCSKSFSSA
jgi:putative DNA primase/helicase